MFFQPVATGFPKFGRCNDVKGGRERTECFWQVSPHRHHILCAGLWVGHARWEEGKLYHSGKPWEDGARYPSGYDADRETWKTRDLQQQIRKIDYFYPADTDEENYNNIFKERASFLGSCADLIQIWIITVVPRHPAKCKTQHSLLVNYLQVFKGK